MTFFPGFDKLHYWKGGNLYHQQKEQSEQRTRETKLCPLQCGVTCRGSSYHSKVSSVLSATFPILSALQQAICIISTITLRPPSNPAASLFLDMRPPIPVGKELSQVFQAPERNPVG